MKPDNREAESKRILARVAAESETIGGSNLARSVQSPQAPGKEDTTERLGRIIGRTLGYIASTVLLIYLFATYFRPA